MIISIDEMKEYYRAIYEVMSFGVVHPFYSHDVYKIMLAMEYAQHNVKELRQSYITVKF
jgi:hypothetical protein